MSHVNPNCTFKCDFYPLAQLMVTDLISVICISVAANELQRPYVLTGGRRAEFPISFYLLCVNQAQKSRNYLVDASKRLIACENHKMRFIPSVLIRAL